MQERKKEERGGFAGRILLIGFLIKGRSEVCVETFSRNSLVIGG